MNAQAMPVPTTAPAQPRRPLTIDLPRFLVSFHTTCALLTDKSGPRPIHRTLLGADYLAFQAAARAATLAELNNLTAAAWDAAAPPASLRVV